MSAELLIYPALFVAIFFESFVLVTFLSAPARRRRAGAPAGGNALPTVAVIVPCYNEETTLARTATSVLALDYPADKLSLILVNDGSTDGTREVMEQFRNHPHVAIIHKENGGKYTALNAGIRATDAEIVGCLDADSFVEPSALRHIIPCFEAGVAAVTAAMSVHEPKNILELMQYAEYLFGIAQRHTLASINGLYVTPGPSSFYRRAIVMAVGGFRTGHQVEDMEMALRLQRHGYTIENAPRARVYTTAPATLRRLFLQRIRWISGFLRNVLFDYRDLVFSPAKGALGMLVLPIGLFSLSASVIVFGTIVFATSADIAQAIALREGIPLAYAYLPASFAFDWFYFPTTFFMLLVLVTIAAWVSLAVLGKQISRTPGGLARGLISFLLFYGLLAPLWIARASVDIVLHKTRSWR
ncbi:hypothetical protein A3E65_01170 [Candidatus Kaiserbacteria bacterium RIFCSPHIGHO2_12_FULL_56_13]|uniref:Glycosyltransferase 2-like domain-containing protein n=1 Tax=Candidatus Kaiserbacteria bacterium RIFCSPHIGHO2_12_FULL_56_13 TaxID=1798505 RepID=A0A1F6EE92_9BACT|nr:MAG: hypothetical protein A3E65_01170 [Candidatus Kaiserbacteria bacterium RIFCSPHIGHO2_12_FULL_56_13]